MGRREVVATLLGALGDEASKMELMMHLDIDGETALNKACRRGPRER